MPRTIRHRWFWAYFCLIGSNISTPFHIRKPKFKIEVQNP